MATKAVTTTGSASGTNPGSYGEASIRVLKGLEPVKQRPGMYTRTDNPLHIIQEVIDNAADEALAGHGKRIAVTLHTDGSITVEDDGRGIPFGMHPEEGVPVVEIVFTRLHAGGKFDKGSGGAYSFSGGLHGVGVSVTNALATRLEVTVWREGQVATLAFSGGDVVEPVATRKGDLKGGDRKQGTTVRVWPDAKYFESADPAHGRAGAPAALQGRADARRHRDADAGEDRRDADLELQGRPARLPAAVAARQRAADPAVRGRAVRRPPPRARTSPRARARAGAWPSPRRARSCARAT